MTLYQAEYRCCGKWCISSQCESMTEAELDLLVNHTDESTRVTLISVEDDI